MLTMLYTKLFVFFFLSLLLQDAACVGSSPSKPNIILMLMDDVSYFCYIYIGILNSTVFIV